MISLEHENKSTMVSLIYLWASIFMDIVKITVSRIHKLWQMILSMQFVIIHVHYTSMLFNIIVIIDQLNNEIKEIWYSMNINETIVIESLSNAK